MRRFAYPNRMQMILCDGKYFRAGANRLKRLAYFYLDDATRKVLHAVCGTSECSELFMRGFYEMITKHGLPGAFYLDRGPGFIAKDCARVAAVHNIPFIFGEVRYPEAHGKVEKFNQTAKNALLRNLAKPEIDPATEALELRLQHYFDCEYNADPHSSLAGKTPQQRFDVYGKDLVKFRFRTLQSGREHRCSGVVDQYVNRVGTVTDPVRRSQYLVPLSEVAPQEYVRPAAGFRLDKIQSYHRRAGFSERG